jgi:hypothetical protein
MYTANTCVECYREVDQKYKQTILVSLKHAFNIRPLIITVSSACSKWRKTESNLNPQKQKLFLMALQPLWALTAFKFPDLFTIDRTPWTIDQLVARPLPKYKTAQTPENIYTHQTSMP